MTKTEASKSAAKLGKNQEFCLRMLRTFGSNAGWGFRTPTQKLRILAQLEERGFAYKVGSRFVPATGSAQ